MKKSTNRFLCILLAAFLMFNMVGTAFASTILDADGAVSEQWPTVESPPEGVPLEPSDDVNEPDIPVDSSNDVTPPQDPTGIEEDKTPNVPEGENALEIPADALSLQENRFNINEQDVILSGGGSYTIFGDGTPSNYRIELSSGEYDITLDNVNIDLTYARDENDNLIQTSALTLKSNATVTMTIPSGTESTLTGGEMNSSVSAYSSRTFTSGKYGNYILSSLIILGDGKLNLYAGISGYNGSPGLGLSGGYTCDDSAFQGPVTIGGNLTVEIVGGEGSGSTSGGPGVYCGPNYSDSEYVRDWFVIEDNAVVSIKAGYCTGDYVAPGITGLTAKITDNATLNVNGSYLESGYLFGGAGIDVSSLLIDGNATVNAFGYGGSPAIDAQDVTIAGDATVVAKGDSSSGIGRSCEAHVYYGTSHSKIIITGNAKVEASGAGLCKDFAPDEWLNTGHGSYGFDIGNYCNGSTDIEISDNAEVIAARIGGGADSTVSITDSAKVTATVITYDYDFDGTNDIFNPSGTVQIEDSAMLLGGIKYTADIQLSGSATIYTKEESFEGLSAASTPRISPLLVFDCGESPVERDILVDGTTQINLSLPAGYRGFMCSVPAGEYTVSSNGFVYKGTNENDKFTAALTDDAIETVFISIPQATISYNTSVGQLVPAQTIPYGARFTKPTSDPTAVGYTFAGWFVDTDCSVPFDFSAIASQDITAYASWTPKNDTPYKVVHRKADLKGNSYTVVETITLSGTTGASVTAEARDYEGFTVGGELPSNTIKANGSTVLTVNYDRIPYTVKFITGKTSEMAPQLFKYESRLTGEDPEKQGYQFAGWYTDNTYQNMLKYRIGAAQDTWDATPGVTTHVISTVNDWASFTAYVNDGGPTAWHTFRLDCDIDFKKANIPTVKEPFSGTFDGMGYTLSNFKSDSPLFDIVAAQASLNNFGIVSGEITITVNGPVNSAMIAGRNDGHIANVSAVHSMVDLYQEEKSSANSYAGGLVAQNYGELEYSYVLGKNGSTQVYAKFPSGTITDEFKQGGLVGYNKGTITGCYAAVSLNCFAGNLYFFPFGSLVGLNGGTIQQTYWKFPYDFNSTSEIKAYTNVDGTVTPGMSLFMGNDLSKSKLATNKRYFFDSGALKLSSIRESLVTEDISLYAKWTPAANTRYAINNYHQSIVGDNYVLADTQVLYGVTDSPVGAIAKEYDGFTENQAHPNRLQAGTIASDGSLVLSFYYDRNHYNISFNSNGGSDVEPQLAIKYGGTATVPETPTKHDHIFDGWYSDELLTTRYMFSTQITSDIVLYAKWIPATGIRYTVEHYTKNLLNAEYTLADTQELFGTVNQTVSAVPKNIPGFTVETSGTALDGIITIDGNLVIKVFYSRNNYSVTFDDSTIPAQTIAYQGLATAPSAPEKVGYIFAGWFNQDLTTEFSFATQITDSINLYAKWLPASGTPYTVNHLTKNLNDSNYTLSVAEFLSNVTGSTVTAVPKSIDGFTVETTGEALTGVVAADGSLVINVYYGRNNYTITFGCGDGVVVPPQTVAYQGNATEPSAPTKNGYSFDGWFLDDKFESPYSWATEITSDITLFAKWTSISYPSTTTYKISVIAGEGGTVSPKSATVSRNGNKTFTITPAEGYIISAIFVDGEKIAPTTSYQFSKVVKNHTLEVQFEKPSPEHVCPSSRYTDINTMLWYHEAIDYALSQGIMRGYTDTTFAPKDFLTRAQFVAIIARATKADLNKYTQSAFDDVTTSSWYGSAIQWAKESGITKGYSESIFAPEDKITREQFVVMLYREYKNDVSVSPADTTSFVEYTDISAWAKEAMDWAIAAELITGVEPKVIAPQANITRAEAAQILLRLLSK